MKKLFAVVFALAISLVGIAQTTQDHSTQRQGLFADRQKYGLVEGKVGRAFMPSGEEAGGNANVFYGGAGISVGIVLKNNLLGIGGAFECVDLMDRSYSFPIFVEFKHYFADDVSRGIFVGAKGGWILGGERSFSTIKEYGEEELLGTTKRSLKGPYGEVMAGYRFHRIDFFVSYNFRVVKYNTSFLYNNPNAIPNLDESWKKNMHVVMGGLCLRLF